MRGDQQVSEEPLSQYLPRSGVQGTKTNATAASFIAPDDLAIAVNVTVGFGKIEAKRNHPIDFEPLAGLNSKAFFIKVKQFAQVDSHAGTRTIETDIDGSAELLTNAAAPIPMKSVAV